MSLVCSSLVQGAIAGGTAAYLQTRAKQESAQKKSNTWSTVALQTNHLFLLAAETVRFAALPLGSFGAFVKVANILVPLTFLSSLAPKQIRPLSPESVDKVNKVYQVGVAVISLATLALGNPAFAAASLAMLTIDVFAQGNAAKVFEPVKKITALLALLGYSAQIFASQSAMSFLAKISVSFVGVKLCLIDWIDWTLPKSVPKIGDPSSETTEEKECPRCRSARRVEPLIERDAPGFIKPSMPAAHVDSAGRALADAALGLCRKSVW